MEPASALAGRARYDPPTTVSIKAQPFKSLLKFIERDLTPSQREAAIAALPIEHRELTRKIVLASDWLPLEAVNRLTEAAASAKGEPMEAFARTRVTGWMQELGEMTKVPTLRIVHELCRAKGASACEWSVKWD